MTPRERLLATFEGRSCDRVPVFHAGFSSQVAGYLLGRPDAHVGGGGVQWREAVALWRGPDAHAEFLERCFHDAVDLAERLDQDLVRHAYWRLPERPTQRLDDWTFLYGDPAGAYRVRRYDPATELFQEIDRRPPAAAVTLADVLQTIDRTVEQTAAFRPAETLYDDVVRARDHFRGERAVRAMGLELNIDYTCPAWLEAVALEPAAVGRYLLARADRAVACAEVAARKGIRILGGGGDFASSRGPFYAPASYRRLWTPAIRRVTDRTRAAGQFYKYASDGNLWPVADDLFPHVDGYFEVDARAGMDLRELRRRYPHLVVFGGINSQTLHRGSPAEVIAETEAALRAAHELGGIVVGCSNQIVAGTPEANVRAMLATIDRLRSG